jgi:FSR family fosmidomycin resistance protein-like MFS transporter
MKYNKYSILTMFSHICSDINQGALPALLPFLVLEKNISYTSAAGLVFAANSMSSFIQPFFGYLGDRVFLPWLMGLGVFLAGGALALVGFLDNYWAIFAAVTVSGIGVALFHPEGGRIANLAAGEKKGSGIALFAVGGHVGFALGPIITAIAMKAFGLQGTAVFLVPALFTVIAVAASLGDLNRLSAESRNKKKEGKQSEEKDDWQSFSKVSACITGRSVVIYGMTTFIPLYFAAVMSLSKAQAGTVLTFFSCVSAAAVLFGGQVADRWGFQRVIRGGFMCLVPLMLIFPMMENLTLAILLLAPIAICLNAPQGATLALGQKYLPNHIGTSSGIMLGIAVSIGGMVAPGIGWIGDHYGLTRAMYAVAGFAVLTMLFAFLIPGAEKTRERGAATGD